MFNVRGDCGHCSQQADFYVVYAANIHPISKDKGKGQGMRVSMMSSGSPDLHEVAYTLWCPLCGEHSILRGKSTFDVITNIKKTIGETEKLAYMINVIEDRVFYPAIPSVADYEMWPEELRKPFLDAQKHFKAGDTPAFVISNIRTILETAMIILGAQGNKIQTKIYDLREKGIITEGMKDWAHNLRIDGNAGAHELKGDTDIARENLAFLRQFLDLCFTLPATIEAKKIRNTEE